MRMSQYESACLFQPVTPSNQLPCSCTVENCWRPKVPLVIGQAAADAVVVALLWRAILQPSSHAQLRGWELPQALLGHELVARA